MSTLYLIRHGQASFGAANYDVLSERGIAQSRRLGEHWGDKSVHLDAVFCGPLERQRDTATHFCAGAKNAGADYPAAEVIDELTEYPAFGLLDHWLPILTETDPEFAALVGGTGSTERIGKALDIIIGRWARGELDGGGLESFTDFAARVERGLRRLMESLGRKKSAAVITSGGPVAVTMRRALGLASDVTVRIMFVIANTAYSEFRFREVGELSLVGFNRHPHLEADLITYR